MEEGINLSGFGNFEIDFKKIEEEVEKEKIRIGEEIEGRGEKSQLMMNRERLEARLKDSSVIQNYKKIYSKLTNITSIKPEILEDLITILQFPPEMKEDFKCRESFYISSSEAQINEGLDLIDRIKEKKESIPKKVYLGLEGYLSKFYDDIQKASVNSNEHLSFLETLKKNFENYIKLFDFLNTKESDEPEKKINSVINKIDEESSKVKELIDKSEEHVKSFQETTWDIDNIQNLEELKREVTNYKNRCNHDDLISKSMTLLEKITKKQEAVKQFKKSQRKGFLELLPIPLGKKQPTKKIKEIQIEINSDAQQINKYISEIQKIQPLPRNISELKKFSMAGDPSKYDSYSDLLIFQDTIKNYQSTINDLRNLAREKLELINKEFVSEYEKLEAENSKEPSSLSELEIIIAKLQDTTKFNSLSQTFEILGNVAYSGKAKSLIFENQKRIEDLKKIIDEKEKLENEKAKLKEYSRKADETKEQIKDKKVSEISSEQIIRLKDILDHDMVAVTKSYPTILNPFVDDFKKETDKFNLDKEILKLALTKKLKDKYEEIKRNYDGRDKLKEDIEKAKTYEQEITNLLSSYSILPLEIISELKNLNKTITSAREKKEKLIPIEEEIIEKSKSLEESIKGLKNRENDSLNVLVSLQLKEANLDLFKKYEEEPYLKNNVKDYQNLAKKLQEKNSEITGKLNDFEKETINKYSLQEKQTFDVKNISELKPKISLIENSEKELEFLLENFTLLKNQEYTKKTQNLIDKNQERKNRLGQLFNLSQRQNIEYKNINSKIEQRTDIIEKDIEKLQELKARAENLFAEYGNESIFTEQINNATSLQEKINSFLDEYTSIQTTINKINNNNDVEDRLRELSKIKDNFELSDFFINKIKDLKAIKFDNYEADKFDYTTGLIEERKKLIEEFNSGVSELSKLLEKSFKQRYNETRLKYNEIKSNYDPNKKETLEEIAEAEKAYKRKEAGEISKRKEEKVPINSRRESSEHDKPVGYQSKKNQIEIKPTDKDIFKIIRQKYLSPRPKREDDEVFNIIKQKYLSPRQKPKNEY